MSIMSESPCCILTSCGNHCVLTVGATIGNNVLCCNVPSMTSLVHTWMEIVNIG